MYSAWTSVMIFQSGIVCFIQTAQMCFQAGTPSPKHLSLWDSLPVDSELIGGLEAAYHDQADSAGNSEIAER